VFTEVQAGEQCWPVVTSAVIHMQWSVREQPVESITKCSQVIDACIWCVAVAVVFVSCLL
jgi:hypothetical protein